MRRRLTVLITFLAGLYFFLEFLLPPVIPTTAAPGEGFRFGAFDEQITIGFTAVGAMAFARGAINIFIVHGGTILRRRRRWGISIALLASLVASACIGAAMWWARSRSTAMALELDNLAAAQQTIISSAQEPILPPHMRSWSEERVPAELRRPATLEERTAAQSRLVDVLDDAAHNVTRQPRPPMNVAGDHPSDDLNAAVAQAREATTQALRSMQDGNDADAASQQAAAYTALRAAASAQRKVANLVLENSLPNKLYQLMFDGLYVALGSAMFSLLAFYIATAAYRAFRIQSGEAFLLMVAAVLVMLGQIPVGVWLVDGLLGLVGLDYVSITQVRLWILRTINTAAFRGIALGSAIAGLSMAWRVWWSMDSGAFIDAGGGDETEAAAPGGEEAS